MNAVDAARLARLAHVLGAPPRSLLVAAARAARLREIPGGAVDLPALVRDARADARFARTAGAVLATPVAGFALDETDRALAVLWSASAADA